MTDTNSTGARRRRAPGRVRGHLQPRRPRKLLLRYTFDEFAHIAQAARDAGLTPTGYAAEAALAASENAEPPHTAPWRSALLELMDARAQVRRIGINLNQAARALNATGEPPIWLERVAAITERAVTRIDEAAATVSAVARHDRRGGGRPRTEATAAVVGLPTDTAKEGAI
jgi:hypothetical protein